jgi:hypothetical protein
MPLLSTTYFLKGQTIVTALLSTAKCVGLIQSQTPAKRRIKNIANIKRPEL